MENSKNLAKLTSSTMAGAGPGIPFSLGFNTGYHFRGNSSPHFEFSLGEKKYLISV